MLDLPDPPTWMRRPELLDHWRMFGAHLIGNGVMKERFTPSLAALCVAYQDFIECATGLSVKDMEKVSRRYMDALARHGLTPASAGSVSVTTKAKPTGLAALKLASA